MIIQIVLVPALVLAVVLSLRSRATLRGQARRKLFAALVVLAGAAAVVFPGLLQALADATGVTRGTDLMLYAMVLVIIYLVGSSSARFREQEARIVLLARQAALADAALRHVGTVAEEAARTSSEQTANQTPVGLHDPVEQRAAHR